MDNFFDKSIEDTLKIIGTDLDAGLSQEEASGRFQKYGENKLLGKKQKSLFFLFMEQFNDFLVIILIVAAVLSIGLGEYVDGVVILAIVVLNGILGVYQENKASNALKALNALASPKAKVLRGGELLKINSTEVVVGDIVLIEAGDYIPADLRLGEAINLKIDESALTGESVAVEKRANIVLELNVDLGDRTNCAAMSSIVTYGRGKGIVTGTGMNTEMGKIASMLNDAPDEDTPLQKKLDSLGKWLGIICLSVCVIIFLMGLLEGRDFFEIFMTAVSLAVAAVPEGLTVVVTVVLAMGMQKMVKSNAIIKRLAAVETLGSTTVICSDKTGTLTQNKMTVVKLFDLNGTYEVTGTGYSPTGEILIGNKRANLSFLQMLITGATLCNDSKYKIPEEQIIGDPTEGALLVLAKKGGIDLEELNIKHPRILEIPFDSERKLMSTVNSFEGGALLFTKGAPDEVLKKCTHVLKNGVVQEITSQDKKQISEANNLFASSALRVLGVAYKKFTSTKVKLDDESDLIFLGLAGMIDPPREEVKEAVRICKEAGIKVKMITGDHKVTASAIGDALGIISENGAIDGTEIEALSDEELVERVKEINVFARVSPEHKVRLIKAVKQGGEIAAMTGDGVNDAPSLKRADIGIAMGITGTDVAKEAADMILTDDNFASIVKAVEEGRTIYSNIRNVVQYLLSCNIGEILIIFIAMLFLPPELGMPLAAIQLLAINLITDAFPAFAIGMEEKEGNIMKVKPRSPNEPILDRKMIISISVQSLFLAFGALGSFIYAYITFDDIVVAETACFVTLVLGELLRAYSARSETKSIFKMKFFGNSFLNKSCFASLVLVLLAVYIPFLNPIFSTTPLAFGELLFACVFAILPVLGGEIAKVLKR